MHFFNGLAESIVQNRTLPLSLGAMPKMAVELIDSLDALVLHDLPKALVGGSSVSLDNGALLFSPVFRGVEVARPPNCIVLADVRNQALEHCDSRTAPNDLRMHR